MTKRDSTLEPLSGLVLSLPLLKIRTSGNQDLAICYDILRHPLTLPPRDQPETLPWTLTADHASVFTVWIGGDRNDVEVYFLINPTCCRAMLASAKTSHPGNTIDQNKAHKATLDFVLHTDFNPLTINCSKKQVSFSIWKMILMDYSYYRLNFDPRKKKAAELEKTSGSQNL